MLGIKHKSFSEQIFIMLILCLFYNSTMLHWPAIANAARLPRQPFYVMDAFQTPCVVYRIVNSKPSVFFQRHSGTITSIALCNSRFFFCSINDRRIYLGTGQQERVVYEHWTHVRDIAVDRDGNLYLSEASGNKGYGTIYKLSPRVNKLEDDASFSIASESRKDPIKIHLKNVDGHWDGDFYFDPKGTLYLSTGRRTPAFIYKIEKDAHGRYGSPRKIYKDAQGAIKGISIEPTNPNLAYYANWEQTIYKLDIKNLRRSVEYSGNVARSRNPHLSDVAFNIIIKDE